MKRTLFLLLILIVTVPIGYLSASALAAAWYPSSSTQGAIRTTGLWRTHPYDLVYTVAYSSEQQPNGPLVVYRASASDLHANVAVAALVRSSQVQTPLIFLSPNGAYLAVSTPLANGHDAMLSLLGSNGHALAPSSSSPSGVVTPAGTRILVPSGVALADAPIWSADSLSLYYHKSITQPLIPANGNEPTRFHHAGGQVSPLLSGYDEFWRVDLSGKQNLLLRQKRTDHSLRLIGLAHNGALLFTVAYPHAPLRLAHLSRGTLQEFMSLPPDTLPGNVLGMSNDGNAIEVEHVEQWQPLRYSLVHIPLTSGPIILVPTDSSRTTLDGQVQAIVHVEAVRADLAAQGITNVPAQEALALADTQTGATQQLELPAGGQIVQAVWATHLAPTQIVALPSTYVASLLRQPPFIVGNATMNASPRQQDEWMLEGHANHLHDAPTLPTMCYGTCANGPNGTPHVSAAILHGVAYVESNWHQFNAPGYQVNGEAVGTPVESFDGGWGEFQQTWAMPPQCNAAHNCRADAHQIQYDQSYNIGVGIQSLISAWNGTAGVTSATDSNNPYKASQWFFAVWAYNGSYGNNPNDVPSSVYGHWYPGAAFRTIYEEYVWYFAAHPQTTTDSYLPSLGSGLLP
ncbi:MAG: hypothetical protein M3Z24_16130, partial [Chloroflexota bacterium]|nr:hypothetical protein [Chloroflexota bacterium]